MKYLYRQETSPNKLEYKVTGYLSLYYRSRYFTDSGIIGSKAFVGAVFDQVKHLLGSKDERRFKRVSGIDGVYSLKRLRTE